jgi:hypothetical protein
MANQQAMLAQAIAQARQTSGDRLRVASAPKTDQFGNTVYYDPNTGQWQTRFTPEQQRLIDQGQQRQERTNLRGAQASEDYGTQRAGYLYDRPQSEAESRAEIARLITQSRGEGDRALQTLVNRSELRQKGNMPVINTGPLVGSDAGKRLAETMLQARSAALNETAQREQMHSSRYLPAMAQFEKTANTVAPIDPTGQQAVQMAQQGSADVQSTYGDLTKALMSAYGAGSGATNAASASLVKAQEPEKLGQYAALIRSMQPNSAQIKANAAAKGVEPQASSTTYDPGSSGSTGTATSGTMPSQFNFPPGAFDTPPEYTYDRPDQTSFNDRWFF